MTILQDYRVNRAKHDGITAKLAHLWAKSAAGREAFFAGLECESFTDLKGTLREEELSLSGYVPENAEGELLRDPSGLALVLLWADPDPDYTPEPPYSTIKVHASLREFLSGQTDFLSCRERLDFAGRWHVSYRMREEYEALREHFRRSGAAKGVAESKARAAVVDIVKGLEADATEQAYGYGVASFYRNEAGGWRELSDGGGPIWGCVGYDDLRSGVWDNFSLPRLMSGALEAGRLRAAARNFAGL